MNKNFLVFGVFVLLFGAAFGAKAQPRPMSKETPQTVAVPAAPNTFAVKYDGGFVGYQKSKGTLTFDDTGSRLVFRDTNNKEIFSLPYESLVLIYPSSKSVRPTAATVASAIPTPFGVGALAGLIKTKQRFLVIQFNDPDSEVSGLTNFRVENKQLLDSVLNTLAEKAKLKQRGDAFYKPRKSED